MPLVPVVPALRWALEPGLAQLDQLLDDEVLCRHIKADLRRRAPHPPTRGRPSTPVEGILRMLGVKRLYGWSDEATERFVADSLVVRQGCRGDLEPVPDGTTPLRWANLSGAAPLAALKARGVALACAWKGTRGRTRRVDSPVAETARHHPTGSGLSNAGGRVLSRLLRQLHRLARRKGEEATAARQQADGRRLEVAQNTCAHARRVRAVWRGHAGRSARRLVPQCDRVLPRVARGIDQPVRRVCQGERGPAREKLVSLFEPPTQIIVRRQPGSAGACGRTVGLGEVDGGLISGYRLLAEAGQDFPDVADRRIAPQQRFGKPPQGRAAGRGVYASANEAMAPQAGIARVVIPSAGQAPPARVARARTSWLRRGLRFRAGIEGRTRVLRRRFGLDRCPDHGDAGLGRWGGWGIVTANVVPIAHPLADRSAPARARAA